TAPSDLTQDQDKKIQYLTSSASTVEYIPSHLSKQTHPQPIFPFPKDHFPTLHPLFHTPRLLRHSFILTNTKQQIHQVTASKVYATL
ncbi:KR domain-containing protein, partial [Bacillus velezensis]|uniref:KR domain-containing protein n=1 Tax=Bacillus velezensis TaxID=492670 RepID=UPI0011A9A17D